MPAKDVEAYLKVLRKGGYDNLLSLKLKVTSREDVTALGITKVRTPGPGRAAPMQWTENVFWWFGA